MNVADNTVEQIIAKENECKARFAEAQKNSALQREVRLEQARKTAQQIVDAAHKDAQKMLDDAKSENDRAFKQAESSAKKKCGELAKGADAVQKKAVEVTREILFR